MKPDSGRVTVRGGTRIGVLDQADTLDDALTVGAAVVGDMPEHEWAGVARIRVVIQGLLGDLPWDAEIGALSGGQRRRVALAALLAGEWDVIALDEPTNHLDVEAITWLARHLKTRWPANAGALLVVTHDRWFLDESSPRFFFGGASMLSMTLPRNSRTGNAGAGRTFALRRRSFERRYRATGVANEEGSRQLAGPLSREFRQRRR